MSIEFEFNTITIQSQDPEDYPKLISKYLPIQKTPKKRRARRKKKKVCFLIDEIIDSIEAE